MEKINGFWTDANRNRWDLNDYTEEQAIKLSGNLINCYDCLNCRYCRDCRGCSGFKSNPKRYTGPFMGSRNAQTTTYWDEEKQLVVCGCFRGTLDEFKNKVNATHGDNEHGKAYQKYIGIVETIINLEKK